MLNRRVMCKNIMKRTTLLLLPGLDGTGIMFSPLLPVLSTECDVKVLPYPQNSKYRYHDLVELVRESLPDNDFFILGESYSGPIALRIASEQPKGLQGIILCATFIKNPSLIFPAFLRFMVVAPMFFVWPVSLKLNVLTIFKNTQELRALMNKVKRVTNNSVLAARTREAIGVNVEKEFTACAYPMLYLCGTRDIVVPKHNLRAMQRLRPELQYQCLNTSHLVLQEAPKEAARHIHMFMKNNLAHNPYKASCCQPQ